MSDICHYLKGVFIAGLGSSRMDETAHTSSPLALSNSLLPSTFCHRIILSKGQPFSVGLFSLQNMKQIPTYGKLTTLRNETVTQEGSRQSLKRNKLPGHTRTQRSHTDILLGKRNESKRTTYCVIKQ